MFFGLDGIEVGLIIVFLSLFAAILSGFPVAFAIAGAGTVSFAIIAALDSAGLLIHQAIDTNSAEYAALIAEGVVRDTISVFRFPDLPRLEEPVFKEGVGDALKSTIAGIPLRINERVLSGPSIETLLAVLMFVLMGITLERSRIADDLLLTMAKVFGPLPGGLAVSIVVVGAFLAASTGIVGATVVTMGLLALPTMLKNNYSPELATGVIAASGTLGQIIPPSIVIVLLGTLAGDIYSTAQDDRAKFVGCGDAFTFLGEPAVVSVGTLFQAALLPGILLAVLYALYAFGFALVFPSKAPPVAMGDGQGNLATRNEKLAWFLAVPAILICGVIALGQAGLVGTQTVIVDSYTEASEGASLRTNVNPQCQAAMIDLHGQEAWDTAVAEQQAIADGGGGTASRLLTDEEREEIRLERVAASAPVGTGISIIVVLMGVMFAFARGVAPLENPLPIIVGAVGLGLLVLADLLFITPETTPGITVLLMAIPMAIALWGAKGSMKYLAQNELLRVVFPPLVLVVAVLGSILGGITNPTPAAALGAGGAIMLAAYRKRAEQGKSGAVVLWGTAAIGIMLLIGVNFDLRIGGEDVMFESILAFIVAFIAFLFSMFALIYSCYVLLDGGVLSPVVRETAKVTAMVFAILIGSQILNLVIISFGGEHYIQQFLRSFDEEMQVFLIVMVILFILGFVLDFLEIIYIVVPIVGPVIYGGTFDPAWVTIMIAVNLQTSFLTPPFGFALFYLRGVAPKEVTTGHIYRGVIPFVLIQVLGLAVLWTFPGIVTIVPNLLGS